MTTYTENRKTHLVTYKRSVLKIDGNGTWRGRSYEHILPNDKWQLNLLNGIREDFCRFSSWNDPAAMSGKFKLHQGFGHLNSSQALCFNLFYPLTASGRIVDFFRFIPGDCDPLAEYNTTFENVLDDGTNTDFCFEDGNFRSLFEIKYTEADLGSAGIDKRKPERTLEAYMSKYHKKYRNGLDAVLNRPLDIDHSPGDRKLFFGKYQFFRYLSQLNEKTWVYFIIPQANPLYDTTSNLIAQWVRADLSNRVHVIGLESLVQTLLNTETFSALKTIYSNFWSKYLGD